MKGEWGLIACVLAGGCGLRDLDTDVPLARDCAEPSARVELCDLTNPQCAVLVHRAVACYANVDPGEAPPVTWGTERSPSGEYLPGLVLEPPVQEALRRLGGPEVVSGRLSVSSAVRVYDSPTRVALDDSIVAASPEDRLQALAYGFGLALLVRSDPIRRLEAGFEDDFDTRAGRWAGRHGRAWLHAAFARLAAEDSARGSGRLYPDRVEARAGDPVSGLAAVEAQGAQTVVSIFRADGDPGVETALATLSGFGELSALTFTTGVDDVVRARAGRRQPPAAAELTLRPGDVLESSFLAGPGFAMLAFGRLVTFTISMDRIALVRSGADEFVVWVSPDRFVTDLLDTVSARPALARAESAGWSVLVVGTSTAADLAARVLEGLP